MRALGYVFVLILSAAEGQTLTILKRVPAAGELRGAAKARDGRIISWGDGLYAWTLPSLTPRLLASGTFGEGGCLVDLDGDGRQEFVSVEGTGLGKLTWRRPSDWKPVMIDDEFETHDCLEATLLGRKGVLVIQRYMQVRFYEKSDSSPWPHREIYSIYTPSQQTGLSLRDIDGDGRVDILCGNYWIRSPERFELPWHIFAINTYFEQPLSAMLAHAITGGRLFVAQAHLQDGRVALLEKPEDPKKLWKETRVEGSFHRVHAVAAMDGSLLFGENNGAASRLFALRGDRAEKISEGVALLNIIPRREGLIGVGPHEVVLWRYRRK
jgi:hypothetical protein